jgi:hypothetical protein
MYSRFAKTTFVMFKFTRAIVQSACSVYVPLPSVVKHKIGRFEQAPPATSARGDAIPMDRPILPSHYGVAFSKIRGES